MPRSLIANAWVIVALALPLSALAARAQTPQIRLSTVLLPEGSAGSADASLKLTLSAAAPGVVTVAYATETGTAIGGAACTGTTDYVTASGTVQFSPGETSQPFGVTVCGDTVVEENEAFRVLLSNAVGATIQVPTSRVTITNDDAPLPTLSIGDLAGVEGGTSAGFIVSLSSPSSQPVTVTFRTEPTTAQPGNPCTGSVDFVQLAPVTGTIRPGSKTLTFSVPICDDNLDEFDETFRAFLSNPIGATLGDSVGQGVITDDDAFAEPTLSLGDRTVVEGNAGATTGVNLIASLSFPSTQPVTFSVRIQTATATLGTACDPNIDYRQFGLSRATISPGSHGLSFVMTICGDSADEPDETFLAVLTNPIGAILGDSVGQVTIADDDVFAPPTLSIGDRRLVEGSFGRATNLLFPVSLSFPSNQPVIFTIRTEPTTATQGVLCGPNIDYVQLAPVVAPGTGTISLGSRTFTFSVPICGDTVEEPDETFRAVLSNPIGAILGDSVGQGTIVDDDAPTLPTLAISQQVVVEEAGTGEQADAVFSVGLSGAPTTRTVTVRFATAPGTASAGTTCPLADYLTRSGTLTFSPGTTKQQIQVPICRDAISKEPPETFTVTLSKPDNAVITGATGTATIRE